MRAHARDPQARASGQVQEIRTTDNSGLYIEHAKKFYQQLEAGRAFADGQLELNRRSRAKALLAGVGRGGARSVEFAPRVWTHATALALPCDASAPGKQLAAVEKKLEEVQRVRGNGVEAAVQGGPFLRSEYTAELERLRDQLSERQKVMETEPMSRLGMSTSTDMMAGGYVALSDGHCGLEGGGDDKENHHKKKNVNGRNGGHGNGSRGRDDKDHFGGGERADVERGPLPGALR